MAFTSPFFQGTQAQGIINNYLNNQAGGLPPYTTPSTNPYRVDVDPFVPPAAQPTPDTPDSNMPNCEELYPGEGRVYDPVLQACVLPEMESQGDGDDNNMMGETYQGVGSVFSPEQNAFMNLGLGSEYFDPENPNKKLDLYGDGISGFLKRFTPFGQLGVYLDAKRLADAGVINRLDGGGYSFAKGGNLALVKANQAFEQDLARKQGLNLDAQADNPYDFDASGDPIYMKQSRGDKADDMGNVYAGLAVQQTPNQSQYGGGNTISYTGNNRGDTSGGEAQRIFEMKQKGPTKMYNTEKFKGIGFTRGR